MPHTRLAEDFGAKRVDSGIGSVHLTGRGATPTDFSAKPTIHRVHRISSGINTSTVLLEYSRMYACGLVDTAPEVL